MRKLLVAAGIAVLVSAPAYAQVSNERSGGSQYSLQKRTDIAAGPFVSRSALRGVYAAADPIVPPMDGVLMPPWHLDVSIRDQGN